MSLESSGTEKFGTPAFLFLILLTMLKAFLLES